MYIMYNISMNVKVWCKTCIYFSIHKVKLSCIFNCKLSFQLFKAMTLNSDGVERLGALLCSLN